MDSTQAIVKVVGRVAGRLRMWRIIEAVVYSLKWCLPAAFALLLVDKFIHVHWIILLAPVAAFVVLASVRAAKSLRGISRFEIAKVIDDRMGLKDQLTSALYFDKLNFPGALAHSAVAEANQLASQLDTGKLSLGSWPKHSLYAGIAALVTLIVAVGPVNPAHWFVRGASDSEAAGAGRTGTADVATADGGAEENPLAKVEPKKPITELAKLESEKPPQRDPSTLDTTMSPETLAEINNIKASLDIKDLKDMADAFKDDGKGKSKDTKDTPPPPIAALDQDMLNDIARSQKTKSDKTDDSKDSGIGVAVKTPSQPGAKAQGSPGKGGGQGGGDVGESGDTRGEPRRVPIAGRDRIVIESRKSDDSVEKTNFEKSVMNEVMMRLSMKDIEMTGKAKDVTATFVPQPRDAVVEEFIPLGLRGYVQRYFEGLAPRHAADKPIETGAEKTGTSPTNNEDGE